MSIFKNSHLSLLFILLVVLLFSPPKAYAGVNDSCTVWTEPQVVTTESSVFSLFISYNEFIKGKKYSFAFEGDNEIDFQVSDNDQKYMKLRISTGRDPNIPQEVVDGVSGQIVSLPINAIYRYLDSVGNKKFIIKDGFWQVMCTGFLEIKDAMFCSDTRIVDNKQFDLGEEVKFEGYVNHPNPFFLRAYDGENNRKDGVVIDNNSLSKVDQRWKFSGKYLIPEGKPGTWLLKGVYNSALGFDGGEINACLFRFGVESLVDQPEIDANCPDECKTDINQCSLEQCKECAICKDKTTVNPKKICEQLGKEGDENYDNCDACFRGKGKYAKDGPGSWTALGCIPTDTAGFVKWLLGPFMGIAGGIAFLLILKGGYQIMFSQGNPESITDGRDTIVAAVSGLVVIILSVAILEIIGVDILDLPGFGRGGNNGSVVAPISNPALGPLIPNPSQARITSATISGDEVSFSVTGISDFSYIIWDDQPKFLTCGASTGSGNVTITDHSIAIQAHQLSIFEKDASFKPFPEEQCRITGDALKSATFQR